MKKISFITVSLFYKMIFFKLILCFALIKNTHFVRGTRKNLKYSTREESCPQKSALLPSYILYDVNDSEGFNLRRDVYMRMAIFVHKLRYSKRDYHLVLPPWGELRHWTSSELETGPQKQIPWGLFFDINSLKQFAPVLELSDFVNTVTKIDNVFILQNYIDFFAGNMEWNEKWSIEPCQTEIQKYEKLKNDLFRINKWVYNNITAIDVKCVSFQGTADLIKDLIMIFNTRTLLIDHAEIIVHDNFGDKLYWDCRKSMKFSKEFQNVGLEYINKHLDPDFTLEDIKLENRTTKGGSYIAVHLRRNDFVFSHSELIPSIQNAAEQIRDKLTKLKLDKVFIATDGTERELKVLKKILKPYKAYSFDASLEIKRKFKDGGIAIIDQIICSYAGSFIGTYESTFTFRIQEEREIYGFPLNSTFNTFCGDDESLCQQPVAWEIVH